ncbi:hypothetical protein D3C81_2045640 [compost metagenome]
MSSDRQRVESAHQQRYGGENGRLEEDREADRHTQFHQFAPFGQRDAMQLAKDAV